MKMKNKLFNTKSDLKDLLKILFGLLLVILVNSFPIILSIMNNNWWLMLLYIIVPILDVLLLVLFKALIDIFKW